MHLVEIDLAKSCIENPKLQGKKSGREISRLPGHCRRNMNFTANLSSNLNGEALVGNTYLECAS